MLSVALRQRAYIFHANQGLRGVVHILEYIFARHTVACAQNLVPAHYFAQRFVQSRYVYRAFDPVAQVKTV
jgi:hypothetical protein